MHIEYLQTKKPQSQRTSGRTGMPSPSDVEQYMLQLQGTMHDGRAAALFSAASTWAYSDLKTFASNMCHCGLYGEFVSIRVTNEAALVDKTAYLFSSHDKQLALLTFKGGQPDCVLTWLENANVEMRRGGVDTAFFAASLVMLPVLQDLLLGWSEHSTSLAEGLEWIRDNRCYPTEVFPSDEQLFSKSSEEDQPKSKKKSTKKSSQKSEAAEASESERRALYICGHGLGGTFAAMFGAMLHLDRNFQPLQDKLRSIYTFGAPMFAPKPVADALDRQFGNRVFRHQYGKDIVPMLSACPQGWSKHFGSGFRNSRMNGGWIPMERFVDDVYAPVMANFFSMKALIRQKLTMMQFVRLPLVWADHLPLRYLRTSLMQAGGQMQGQGFAGDFPGPRY